MTIDTRADLSMIVDGRPSDAHDGGRLEVRSPATGDLVGSVPAGSPADVDRAVAVARSAFRDGRWSRRPPGERTAVLNRLADLIDEQADEIARVETLQTGSAYKLRRDSDLPFAADNLRFFAGAARDLEGKSATEYTGRHTSMVRREPVGVCAQVAPWNYPFWMAIWKVAPALAAGNAVIAKPPSECPLTLLKIAALMEDTGLPQAAHQMITGPGPPLPPLFPGRRRRRSPAHRCPPIQGERV